ncbi:MAG: hypothetical protein WA004_01445 [Saprospiraceae bacterium]
MRNRKAVLIGNGINRVDSSQSISWPDLLENLANIYRIKNLDLKNPFKPFPLVFEEIINKKTGDSDKISKIRELKKRISEILRYQTEEKKGFNEYHQRIMNSSVSNILTTNYDYGFELSVVNDFLISKGKYAENNQERKSSLKRRYLINVEGENKRIWHIHGELFDNRTHSEKETSYPSYAEESILIGYEHYSEYFDRIQGSIKGKFDVNLPPEKQNVITRVRNGSDGVFWVDFFFGYDLFILGIGLDFSENHLWWLLTKRSYYISRKNRATDTIQNKIIFLMPNLKNNLEITPRKLESSDAIQEWYKNKTAGDMNNAIGDILEAFQIEKYPINCRDYPEFYSKAIDFIDSY